MVFCAKTLRKTPGYSLTQERESIETTLRAICLFGAFDISTKIVFLIFHPWNLPVLVCINEEGQVTKEKSHKVRFTRI